MAVEGNSIRAKEGEIPPGSPPLPNRTPDSNSNSNPNPNPNIRAGGGSKGKSCKGCMYYSSLQKSKSKNPTCVGISGTLKQVPGYIVGETELEASKEGRVFADFKYACVGYSVFLEKNGEKSTTDPQNKQAELPFCVGLEILMDKRTTPAEQVHAHTQKQEDGHSIPQRRTLKPATSITTGDDYLNRFRRNASLVASGVAKNVNKVGIFIKESMDDVLYPYRRRPK